MASRWTGSAERSSANWMREAVAVRGHAGDLADVDAGDPHRVAAANVDAVGHDRIGREAVREGQVPVKRVGGDGDHDEDHERCDEKRRRRRRRRRRRGPRLDRRDRRDLMARDPLARHARGRRAAALVLSTSARGPRRVTDQLLAAVALVAGLALASDPRPGRCSGAGPRTGYRSRSTGCSRSAASSAARSRCCHPR